MQLLAVVASIIKENRYIAAGFFFRREDNHVVPAQFGKCLHAQGITALLREIDIAFRANLVKISDDKIVTVKS